MASNRNLFSFDNILILVLVAIVGLMMKNHLNKDKVDHNQIKRVPHLVQQNGKLVQNPQMNRNGTTGLSQFKTSQTKALDAVALTRAQKDMAESEKVVNNFSLIGRLQFQTPVGFKFKNVDADDYLIITGENNSNQNLTMMAGRVSADENQIKPFVKEHLDLFGGRVTPAHVESLQKVQEYKNFNRSGDVVVMHSEVAGRSVFVGVMKRNDKQGSYMFVLEGEKDLKDNTDYFEDVFETLKTQ